MNQLRISAKALAHNFWALKSRLSPSTKLIAVVKANAYGHGAVAVAKQLEALQTDYLAVAYVAEGQELREAGIQLPIMVFYPQIAHFKTLIDYRLEPVLYSKQTWHAFSELLQSTTAKYPVHIKYNTGLNRIGFLPEEANWVIANAAKSNMSLISVYSHLIESEGPRPHRASDKQINTFLEIKALHEKDTEQSPWFHLLNTSGVYNYPEQQLDAVRCGIGLYGFANHPEWDQSLQPIATLESVISQIHHIQKGETVGYDQGWVAPKDSVIATLPLGHADGIGRHFGKQKGTVCIGATKVPIVGNVCMDMLMIDVSNFKCQVGDTVQIFGNQQSAATLARQSETISYELLTGIGSRVFRIWEP